ncbi:hypothetical protein MGN70_013768 [Eutypa lata]|nr:hypothetical protein MGN70_013768 [Eutypa lata]
MGQPVKVPPTQVVTQPRRQSPNEDHKRTPTWNHPRLYMCGIPGCQQTFTLEKDLERHQLFSQAHRGYQLSHGELPLFKCREGKCKSYGKVYSRRDNYGRHVRTLHKRLKQ